MAITVTEILGSRPVTVGRSSSAELKYQAVGSSDDAEIYDAVAAAAPASYRNWPIASINLEPDGAADIWKASVRYQPAGGQKKEPSAIGEVTISFDTTGGTQHITQSLSTISRTGPVGDTAPDYKGAIGVTSEAVEGCDVTVPVFNFTVTKVFAAGSLPNPGTIFALTGSVNAAPFSVTDSKTGLTITLAAGECLFMGGRAGGQRGDGGVEFSYSFAGSPNKTDIAIGNITVPSKKGWEYLWVRYRDVKDDAAKMLVKRPFAAYVEKVYPDGAFAGLGL